MTTHSQIKPCATNAAWYICTMFLLFSFQSKADTVIYTFDNVVLDDSTSISGSFSWTYSAGDFENGTSLVTELNVPHTLYDETDLDMTVDTGNSIEITFPGNLHDDGVDITLFLAQPLSPTEPAPIDLVESKYEIGGNGFYTGGFVSGSISPLVDQDSDGIADSADNCTLIANANQRDTNSDGYGNLCDPDLNNDGVVNYIDVSMWVPFFNTAASGDTDFNGDGSSNFADFVLFPVFFLTAPGPSGAAP